MGVARILKTKLPWFREGVDIVDTTHEPTTKVSPEFGVKTRYLRTTCHGKLRDDFVVHARTFRMSQTRDWGQGESSPTDKLQDLKYEEVVAVWNGDAANLYAWLLEKDYEYLSSPAGASVLENWITNIDPPNQMAPCDTIPESLMDSQDSSVDREGESENVEDDTPEALRLEVHDSIRAACHRRQK